jgi:hypothetical protein
MYKRCTRKEFRETDELALEFRDTEELGPDVEFRDIK